jgi:hypothetical protein
LPYANNYRIAQEAVVDMSGMSPEEMQELKKIIQKSGPVGDRSNSKVFIAANTPMYDEGIQELRRTFGSYDDFMKREDTMGTESVLFRLNC